MAAQYGNTAIRFDDGTSVNLNTYFDDTAGNLARFDPDGSGVGTASPTDYTIPKNGVVSDVCLAAATAQTRTSIIVAGRASGTVLHNALHLASIVTRPYVGIRVFAGQKIQFKQIA